MAESDLLERLRTELPRLLREHPEVRHEVWGLRLEAFPSREEFARLLDEVRVLREDFRRHADETAARFAAMDRRFEELRADMNQRFEAVDRRFEAVLEALGSHREQLEIHGKQWLFRKSWGPVLFPSPLRGEGRVRVNTGVGGQDGDAQGGPRCF